MIRILILNLGFVVFLTACGLFDSDPPTEGAAQDTAVAQTDQTTPETQETQEEQDYKERVLEQEKALDQQEKETAALTSASAEEAPESKESADSILNLLEPAASEEEVLNAEALTEADTATDTDAGSSAESDETELTEEEMPDPEEVVDPEAQPLQTEADAEVTTDAETSESAGMELAPAAAIDTEFREVEETAQQPAGKERKIFSPEERAELLENIHSRLLKAQGLGLPMVRDPRVEQLVSTVFFGFDNSRLTKEFLEQLIKEVPTVLEELENRGDLILQIEGHADERGDEEYNLALGHRRANTVHNLLKVYVTDPMTLRTISFGEEFPVIPDSNKEAWAKNRRVAFTFLLREL